MTDAELIKTVRAANIGGNVNKLCDRLESTLIHLEIKQNIDPIFVSDCRSAIKKEIWYINKINRLTDAIKTLGLAFPEVVNKETHEFKNITDQYDDTEKRLIAEFTIVKAERDVLLTGVLDELEMCPLKDDRFSAWSAKGCPENLKNGCDACEQGCPECFRQKCRKCIKQKAVAKIAEGGK